MVNSSRLARSMGGGCEFAAIERPRPAENHLSGDPTAAVGSFGLGIEWAGDEKKNRVTAFVLGLVNAGLEVPKRAWMIAHQNQPAPFGHGAVGKGR